MGGSDAPKVYYLRAVSRDWTTTEPLETGTSDANAVLHLPRPLDTSAYAHGSFKLMPGVLADFQLPQHGEVMVTWKAAMFNATEFRGVLLGWDDQDYFVRPLHTTEIQTYDTSRRACDSYDVSEAVRVPRAYLLNVGQPEVQVFPVLPFGVYAALVVPTGYSQIQVYLDDVEIGPEQQAALLPSCLFSEKPDSSVGPMSSQAGLVLSRVSLLVDGVRVSVLVPLCHLK